MRIEDLAESADRLAPDVVSARALAPLPRLFELASPFFGRDTRGLFLKGREAEAEIEAARAGWETVPAVATGQLHEIKSSIILQPGPAALTDGVNAIHDIIKAWQSTPAARRS